jgi:hypothetical protein
MSSTQNNIRRVVMRRVYTMFVANVVSHPLTLQSGLFATAFVVFAEVVHVKRVAETIQAMPIAQVPEFIFLRLLDGEVLTLLALGIMIFTALSIPWQFKKVAPLATHRTEEAV